MSEISPYSSALSGSEIRQANRSFAETQLDAVRSQMAIRAQADVSQTQLDAVSGLGARAMQNIAAVSSMEQQLAQQVPHAGQRLAAIADVTTAASLDIIVDAAQRFRR